MRYKTMQAEIVAELPLLVKELSCDDLGVILSLLWEEKKRRIRLQYEATELLRRYNDFRSLV